MESPKNLSHKPIISVRAQYDENEISLKVWRHTGKRWSRQSEELPL